MASLDISIGGLRLSSPILLGSATPTWDGEHSSKGFHCGAGASVIKTIAPGEEPYHHPQNGRFVVLKHGNVPYGMINVEIFSTFRESEWTGRELFLAKEGGAKIIASTLAAEDPEESAALIRRVEATGCADAIELNNSCPMHVDMNDFNIVPMTVEQTSAARNATKLPLLVKFPSTVTSLNHALKAAEACGADAVVISNSMSGFAGVDIETGLPRIGTMGGYSGAAIKPLIEARMIGAAQSVQIPIIAVGGVNSWEDVVEYIMLGATAVQVVSAVMWQGYDIVDQWNQNILAFMEAHGYETIDDMRGIALPHIGSYDSILNGEKRTARIDPAVCRGCGKCIRTCFYDAISMPDASNGSNTSAKATVNPEKCDGCGLCTQLCPFGAVKLV